MHTIRLNKDTANIRLLKDVRNIEITKHSNAIKFYSGGKRGLQGFSAYDIAVLEGFNGTESQWLDTLTGDKNYSVDFTMSSTVSILHNLNKYPSVTVFDSAGDEVEGSVSYNNLNSVTVTFSAPFSGKVICN